MDRDQDKGYVDSAIRITVEKLSELKTDHGITRTSDGKADSRAALTSLPLRPAAGVPPWEAPLASPDSICSSPGDDSTSSAHGTDSEVADALCRAPTTHSPLTSPTRRPHRMLGSRLRHGVASPSRLSPQTCVRSPSPTLSMRSISPGPMRERSNTAPSKAYIEAYYTSKSALRIPRDPIQPTSGSINDLSTRPECENSSDEDCDVFKPLPEMRPRSRTCPEKGAFRKRALARAKGRPPTPPPGMVADGTIIVEKQDVLSIMKDKLHIHERDMPDVPEDDSSNANENIKIPVCIQDVRHVTNNLTKPVPFKPTPVKHDIPRIVKKDSNDRQETLFNPG